LPTPAPPRHHIPCSALFENYDEDFKQLLASLKGKLDGDVKLLKGGQLR
jgi:hypothetical protein